MLLARTTAAQAICPTCGYASSRVHSRYWRTLQDLPWQDRAVTWRVLMRRFRCSHCQGRIFVERIPGLMGSKARRTARLAEAQTEIGMVLGGEAGARLSRRLSMPVRGDTVLRLIRRRPPQAYPAPRVVGIDDWAWRRGRRYGTIVCDLERRRVLALLPGRSSAPVRDGLAAHPGIAVVSRDRAGPYAEAARSGAPTAIQVADRWHLLVNASEALRSVVARHQTQIQEAAGLRSPSGSMPVVPIPTPSLSQRSENRRRRFDDVLRHHGEGLPILQITHRTGLARNTVRRDLRAGRFVQVRPAPGPSLLDRHRGFAEARWQEGLRSGAALHRELRARGFGGGVDIVRRWIAQRQETAQDCSRLRYTPSTRRTTRLLASDPTKLVHEERAFIDALCKAAAGRSGRAGTLAGRGSVDGIARLRGRPAPGSGCRTGGDHTALEQRAGRRSGQPPQADQAADVRSCRLRPPAAAGAPCRVINDQKLVQLHPSALEHPSAPEVRMNPGLDHSHVP